MLLLPADADAAVQVHWGLPQAGGASALSFRRRASSSQRQTRPNLSTQGGRIALFPDTVSQRAQRHMRELTALAHAGRAAACVFVVQRDDCAAFAPCHEARAAAPG